MIKTTMHHGEEIQQGDLPRDFLSLKISLFQKNVPANVQNYICKNNDVLSAAESPNPKKSKPDDRQVQLEVLTDG